MQQADTTQEHVQGFRSVHRSQPPSTTSVPLDSPEVVHIECYTDPDTNKDYILWEDIQQAFYDALSVRNRTKVLPFAKGKDLRALEPRRIAALPDAVLDVVVGGESTAAELASMGRAMQHLSGDTPPQSPASSARRNPAYGDVLDALQNYNHMNVPASLSNRRGPQIIHDERKDDDDNPPTEQGYQTKAATKILLNPQDYDAAANMDLMRTMINANQGDIHAQVALGDRYKDGREVHQDHNAALDWYLKAAERGHPRAQYNIGLMYEEDDEEKNDKEREDKEGDDAVLQDNTKAFEWLFKSAVQGYVDAQVKVSQAYTNGAGVPKDNIKAMEWAVKAAENGHAGMQYNMGAAYENGQGVPQSDSRSFEWYLMSADQGFAEAQVRVARAFEGGRGVPEDGPTAVKWYTKAADQDLPLAQFALGCIHNLGRCGLPIDWSKAVDWFIKAAIQGHIEAQSMLRAIYNRSTARILFKVPLGPEDKSKIKDWFIKAVEQGAVHAQFCMGEMYSDGHGVQKDESKAFEWYLKAAEQVAVIVSFPCSGTGADAGNNNPLAQASDLSLDFDLDREMDRARSEGVLILRLAHLISSSILSQHSSSHTTQDKDIKPNKKSKRMQQADIIQEHVQGFRSVHRNQPPSTTSVPLSSPEVVHIDCYTDPDTNKDFILWEDIQQAFSEALSVRSKAKMLPFAKGKDLRALEPRRIAAVPDVVLDVVVDGKSEAASVERAVQELSLNTPPQSSSSSTRRNPAYGDVLEAMQNYNHIDFPASISHLRGPHTIHDEHKDDSSNTPTNQSHRLKTATKNLLNPQDETAAKDMTLMQTMVRANHGDIQAQVALGDRYKDGREVNQDSQAAMDWYSKAAEQGHPRAQYGIGLLYNQGFGNVPQDHTKAFDWLHKSALQGYPDAQAKVSQAYTDGAGVPKDNIKAMEWSVKAAENGHAGMQYNMGAAYENGQGVPQSDSRSFEWYLKSADQGYAEAQARVASAFEAGRGVPEDDRKAVEWYTKAADRGLAVAQFALGHVHRRGLCGVPKDWTKAVGWFVKAAVQGHIKAQSTLREIYDYTRFSPLDLQAQSKIKGWFFEAAGLGVVHAQCCMAYMYEEGSDVDKDNVKAFGWYLKAAEQGDDEAQSRVAFRYKRGLGVTESREKAIECSGKCTLHMEPIPASYIPTTSSHTTLQTHYLPDLTRSRRHRRNQPPSPASIPLDSPEVVHVDCYIDPNTNKDFIFWEDIQQAFNAAFSVWNKAKMLPFVRGKDYTILEPRRIAAVPDVVLDVVVGGELTAAEVASMERTVQDLSLNTPPRSSSSRARRNPAYGDILEALQNYSHMDVPAFSSHLRGPQAVHDERKDDSSNAPTEQGRQPSAVTKNLANPQDYDAAANMGLMQTMINAHHGDIQAQVALEDRYKDGREVHQDYQAAKDWYLKPAEQGHPRAQFNIGLLYRQGHDSDPKNHSKAFKWFLKAAVQGHADAQGMVSQSYTNGAGVPKDNIKAMEWSIKAAENGHAEMQHYMGDAYEKGHGVPQSDSKSFEWYLKSAGQGFAKAQVQVGAAFEAGRGVPKDGAKAVEWYTKAADQGLAVAQFALGHVHRQGVCGLPKDRSEAVDWYLKAAAQEHTDAQSMLRVIYYDCHPNVPGILENKSYPGSRSGSSRLLTKAQCMLRSV
ncbi:MAG: hypothetical protein JOS17DRAFT_820503 [Linnemannia elongata]|nr:MAG: hypothetical protein JOS17DRAFT_820503 [Linnemannia elongata]